MIKLVEINEGNWIDFSKLSVDESQKRYLANNIGIIARGYVYRDCVEVCVKMEDAAAIHMYEKAGFIDTGYIDEDVPDSYNLVYKFKAKEETANVTEVKDSEEKKRVTRLILEALPDWFGIEESREEYIAGSVDKAFFAVYEEGKPAGFLYLKETGKDTVELAVMGVLQEYHRKGIGKQLFERAKAVAKQKGYTFMQVKTVQMGKYEDYDATNRFYLSLGFKEFEVFPLLWDEWNPCQVYVMIL